MSSLEGRDILSARDVTREELEHIFAVADKMEPVVKERRRTDLLKDKVLAALFFQSSTRTRLSFESAMVRLGGGVVGFADPKASRSGSGYAETLWDTAQVINGYADVVAMRHPEVGSVAAYAKGSTVPVINGGDGYGTRAEHPTQVMLDLYTMKKELGTIDGLEILMIGDLNYRVPHSFGYMLPKFEDIKLYLLCPDDMWYPPKEEQDFRELGLDFERVSSIDDVIREVDVIYQNDMAKSWSEITPEEYQVTRESIGQAKKGAIVMHPLPRMAGLSTDVDDTPHARYFEESAYGVPVRMALLALLLGKEP